MKFIANAIALLVINILTILVNLSINCLFLITLIVTRTLHTPSNVLLGAICISDILVGLLSESTEVADFIFYIYGRNEVSFQLKSYLVQIPATFSFQFILLISMDRWLAICYPFFYERNITCSKYLWMALAVVVFLATFEACVFSAYSGALEPWLAWWNISFLVFVIITIIILYMSIYRQILRQRSRVITVGRIISMGREEQQVMMNRKRRNKKAYTIALILGVFLACYVPFLVYQLVDKLHELSPAIQMYVGHWVTWLRFVNSCMDPVLYCARITEIREAAKAILRKRLPNWS